MDGVHEYLLEAQMDLVNSNLLGWWFKHSNGVEYKNFEDRFLDHFSRFALGVGRDDLLELMLKNGARVNFYGKEEDSLIFFALSPIGKTGFSSVRMLKLIIAAGADVNIFSKNGELNPLMMAINNNAFAHAVILLNAGADLWVRSEVLGLNAIEFALSEKKNNFIEIMRESY